MTEEVREAVQIILDRMKSHPEEFDYRGRFGWVLDVGIKGFEGHGLTKHEMESVKQGLDELNYRKFHDSVMKSMLQEPTSEQDKQEKYLYAQGSSLRPISWDPTITRAQLQMEQQKLQAQLLNAQQNALRNSYQSAIPGALLTDGYPYK